MNDENALLPTQSQTNTQSKSSSVTKFLNSLGKNFTSSSSSTTSNKGILMEEIATYRSLAQREYNSIVDGEKESSAVSLCN